MRETHSEKSRRFETQNQDVTECIMREEAWLQLCKGSYILPLQ